MLEELNELFPKFLTASQNGKAAATTMAAAINIAYMIAGRALMMAIDIDEMPEWRLNDLLWEYGRTVLPGMSIDAKREWIRNATRKDQISGTRQGLVESAKDTALALNMPFHAIDLSYDMYTRIVVWIPRHDNQEEYTAYGNKVIETMKEYMARDIPVNVDSFILQAFRQTVGLSSHMFANTAQIDMSVFGDYEISKLGWLANDAKGAFEGLDRLEICDMSVFGHGKLQSVPTLKQTWRGCTSLKEIVWSADQTGYSADGACLAGVTDITDAWRDCKSMEVLKLPTMNLTNVTGWDAALLGCENLKRIEFASSYPTAQEIPPTTIDLSDCDWMTRDDGSMLDLLDHLQAGTDVHGKVKIHVTAFPSTTTWDAFHYKGWDFVQVRKSWNEPIILEPIWGAPAPGT